MDQMIDEDSEFFSRYIRPFNVDRLTKESLAGCANVALSSPERFFSRLGGWLRLLVFWD